MIMNRVKEPELMQNPLQVKAYAEADFSASDNSLIDRIEKYCVLQKRFFSSLSLLCDLGCGPGNIAEGLSQRCPSATVLGIDGSQAMLDIAMDRQKKLNLNQGLGNISYHCCDISSIASEESKFDKQIDLIVSNSLLHHLHDPGQFWKALKVMSSKATVHVHRDLRRPSSVKAAIALQKKYLPDSPKVLIRDYLASLQAAFTVAEIKNQLCEESLDFLSVHEVDDRYLEVVGIF